MPEIFRIESIGPEDEGAALVRRIMVRVDSVETAKKRALKILERARQPQARALGVERVRLVDGAGYEIFSVSVRD
ncbi:hypothetical protein [Microvirga flavescens]|uniref:hypothetical protein n=1 Tax=Microvirga flavescens TaxID=2249811 RepID=UPI000DD63FEE|nr:hypothetical protein [Microvirga flavescens]